MLPQPDANVLLGAFLSDPGEAVVGFGLDGAIFLWNQAAQELYGFTQAEKVGKPIACLLPLYERPAHDNLLQNPLWNEPLLDAVAERLKRNGLRISVQIRRSPIRATPGGKLLAF
jgi:PAS domain S-box-containing protein